MLIEKHFILDRNDGGPDSSFSIEPGELEALVNETKDAALSLGGAGYDKKPAEEANSKFRRSLYFIKDMKKGEVVTKDSVKRIRPGFGLKPKYYLRVMGKKLNIDVKRGTPVKIDFFDC